MKSSSPTAEEFESFPPPSVAAVLRPYSLESTKSHHPQRKSDIMSKSKVSPTPSAATSPAARRASAAAIREAVGRYHEALRTNAETAAACGDRVDAATDGVREATSARYLSAEWRWNGRSSTRPGRAVDVAAGPPGWPSRGVRCGGLMYVVRPDRDAEDRFVDGGAAPDEAAMQLTVIDMANVVDLDEAG